MMRVFFFRNDAGNYGLNQIVKAFDLLIGTQARSMSLYIYLKKLTFHATVRGKVKLGTRLPNLDKNFKLDCKVMLYIHIYDKSNFDKVMF